MERVESDQPSRRDEDNVHYKSEEYSSASIVLGTSICAVSFSFVLISVMKISDSTTALKIIVKTVYLIILSLGIMYVLYLIFDTLRGPDHDKGLRIRRKCDLQNMFLWSFALGSLFNTSLQIFNGMITLCMETFGDGNLSVYILYFIFVILQTVCMTLRKKRNFRVNIKADYGFMYIIVVNMNLWFICSIWEFNEHAFDAYRNTSYAFNETINCNSWGSLIRYSDKVIEKTAPFLAPIILEYALISISIVLSLRSKFKLEIPTNNQYFELRNWMECGMFENEPTETMSLIGNRSRNRGIKTTTWHIIVIGIMLSFPMVICEILVIIIRDSLELKALVHVFIIINNFIIIIFTSVVSCLIGKRFGIYNASQEVRNSSEIPTVFSCLGFQMFMILDTYEISKVENLSISYKGISSIGVCTSLFAGLFQTTLLLKLQRINLARLHSAKHVDIVKKCLKIMSIVNFAFWLGDSFLLRKYMYEKALEDFTSYGENWFLIVRILLPVTIFYRFHCGIDLFEASE